MSTVALLPGYYTLTEAAEVLGIKHSQVAKYVRRGLLPAKDIGHQKLIEQEVVHKFERPPVGNPQFRRRKPDIEQN